MAPGEALPGLIGSSWDIGLGTKLDSITRFDGINEMSEPWPTARIVLMLSKTPSMRYGRLDSQTRERSLEHGEG